MTFSYFIILVVHLFPCISTAASSCPDGWMHHGAKCYHFSHDQESLPVAALVCKQLGGLIVEIENAAENAYLSAQVTLLKRNYWIGLTDLQEKGSWRWYESGRMLKDTGFQSWGPNLPDNYGGEESCAFFRANDGLWGDHECQVSQHYICEKNDEAVDIVG